MLGLKNLKNFCFSKLSKGLIRIKGPEAATFLQGIISNQIYNLEGFKDPKKNITSSNEKCLYSGLFTSQGRIFCDAFLYPESSKEANSLLMECDLKIKDELITHLKKFKIRVKADILDASQEYNVWTVFGRGIQTDFDFIHHSSNRDVLVAKDPRLSSLGWRIVVPSTSQLSFPSSWNLVDSSVYTYYRILHGVPEGTMDLISNHSLPFESTLDYLNAISYDKGCYLGQELTTRTRHSGVTRKRLFPFLILSNSKGVSSPSKDQILSIMDLSTQDNQTNQTLIPSVFFDDFYSSSISISPATSLLTLDGKKTGMVHSTLFNAGLAMVRLEHVDHSKIENTILELGEVKNASNHQIQLIRPHWWEIYLKEKEEKD